LLFSDRIKEIEVSSAMINTANLEVDKLFDWVLCKQTVTNGDWMYHQMTNFSEEIFIKIRFIGTFFGQVV